MGRSIPVTLGRYTYPSKSAADEALRILRDKYRSGDPILEEDDLELLRAVVGAHPHAAEKIGAGIAGFFVAKAPQYGTYCFYLARTDGTVIDFSWKEALTPTG
jgi:hypothetical protein